MTQNPNGTTWLDELKLHVGKPIELHALGDTTWEGTLIAIGDGWIAIDEKDCVSAREQAPYIGHSIVRSESVVGFTPVAPAAPIEQVEGGAEKAHGVKLQSAMLQEPLTTVALALLVFFLGLVTGVASS